MHYLSDKLIHKIRSKSDFLIVLPCSLQLAENVFHTQRLAVGININISTRDMKQYDSLLHTVWNLKCVDISRGLECIASFCGPPEMLKVVPFTTERCGMNWTRVSVTRKDPGAADAEEIHEISLGDRKEERAEANTGRLRNPHLLLAVKLKHAGDDKVFGYIGKQFATVRNGLRVWSCHD